MVLVEFSFLVLLKAFVVLSALYDTKWLVDDPRIETLLRHQL